MIERLLEEALVQVIKDAADPALAGVQIVASRSQEDRNLPFYTVEVTRSAPKGRSLIFTCAVEGSMRSHVADSTQAQHAAYFDAADAALRAKDYTAATVGGVRFLGPPFFGEKNHGREDESLWLSAQAIAAGVQAVS